MEPEKVIILIRPLYEAQFFKLVENPIDKQLDIALTNRLEEASIFWESDIDVIRTITLNVDGAFLVEKSKVPEYIGICPSLKRNGLQ